MESAWKRRQNEAYQRAYQRRKRALEARAPLPDLPSVLDDETRPKPRPVMDKMLYQALLKSFKPRATFGDDEDDF